MIHLLTRRYLIDWKLINKKLWREVFIPSQNVTFHQCTFQERGTLTRTNYHTSASHCHRSDGTKIFTDVMGCKSLASRKHCESSFVQRSRLVNQQRVHLSTASSLDNDGNCTAENCLKFDKSNSALSTGDSALRTEVDGFAEKLQNCASPEEILTLAESTMHTKPHIKYLPMLFSSYQEQVYKTLTFPWLLPECHLKKIQLEYNFLVNHTIEPHTTDSRFQNLMTLAEELVRDVSYSDSLQILHSLHYLFISTTNSSLARKLCDVCSEHLDEFDLNQLARFSVCIDTLPSDVVLFGKIANVAKRWLLTHAPRDVDLQDLCLLFNSTRFVFTIEMFKLGADTIISKLKTDPSRITLDMISKISLFSQISYNKCEHDLLNAVQNLPTEYFDVDISERDLTMEVCSAIGKNIFVCPVLDKIKRICISEVEKAVTLSVNDVMRYSFLLSKLSKPVMGNSIGLFLQHVKQSDNYLLLQMMKSHSDLDLLRLPGGKQLLDAYHQRFIKIFTSYSQSEQTQLLWQSGGHFGRHLFLLICKLKASGLTVDKCVIAACNDHFLLSPNEWDAPYIKVVVNTLYIIEQLRSNILISPSSVSAMEKQFIRTDYAHLMYLIKSLDFMSTQSYLSYAVKQQCLQLKTKFEKAFESKLSRADTLPPHFASNKIVPGPKKHPFKNPAGSEAYGLLMDNLPRLLKDKGASECLQVLKILDYGIEVFPVHQKEMFETLTSFVTSSPTVLLHPGLQLVKILACAGYQTDINGSFTTWTQDLVVQVLRQNHLGATAVVNLGYYLSLLGIFHDPLIIKIFSLDFLSALEQELIETSDKKAAYVKNKLSLLNRSVVIECPQLAVSWFGKHLRSSDNKFEYSGGINGIHQVVKSINRLIGDTGYVKKSAKSPYGHHIDAVMFFVPNSGLLKCDVQNRKDIPGIEKIVLLCPQRQHFCYSSDVLHGQYQADIRQLQMLGCTVVLFTEKELSSMEVSTEEGLDNYIKSKVNASSHVQVFGDRQQ